MAWLAPVRGRRGAVERVVERVVHPFPQRFQHRDVDVLPAPRLLSMHQRREDVGVGVHSRGDVGNRRAGLGGLLLRSRDRHEPGFALDQEIVRFLVAVGTIVPISGNVAHDNAGLVRRQRDIRQTQARSRAGCQVLHHDIRLLANESLEDHLRFRMLDVQREAFLGAVGPDEVRRQAAHAFVIASREITHPGAFDLDHPRAEIGQLAGREGCGDRMFERNDGNAGKRSHDQFLTG